MRQIRTFALVGGISLVVLGATVTTALAAGTSVSLDTRAKLLARGAGVSVTVTYSCMPAIPNYVGLNVQVSEVVGKRYAFGSGQIANNGNPVGPLTCDSATHTAHVTVLADHNGKPFTTGTTIAQAQLSGNNNPDVRDNKVINITGGGGGGH